MIDKVVFISDSEVMLVFTNRPSFRVRCKDALGFAHWLLHGSFNMNKTEYIEAYTASLEDTQKIAM